MDEQDEEREERRKRLQAMTPEARMLSVLEKLVAWADAHEEESSRRAEEAQRRSDEMHRNMDFIVQQQAQFSADLQSLRKMQEHSERRWERIERMWERTEGSVRSLHAIAQIHEGEITVLAERQAEVGERVNALVNTVERLISEKHNGDGQGK